MFLSAFEGGGSSAWTPGGMMKVVLDFQPLRKCESNLTAGLLMLDFEFWAVDKTLGIVHVVGRKRTALIVESAVSMLAGCRARIVYGPPISGRVRTSRLVKQT
jgi:hypothetical protein